VIKPKLDFTNGNNAALSLHALAEYCRRGEAKVLISDEEVDEFGALTITLFFPEIKGPSRG